MFAVSRLFAFAFVTCHACLLSCPCLFYSFPRSPAFSFPPRPFSPCLSPPPLRLRRLPPTDDDAADDEDTGLAMEVVEGTRKEAKEMGVGGRERRRGGSGGEGMTTVGGL